MRKKLLRENHYILVSNDQDSFGFGKSDLCF